MRDFVLELPFEILYIWLLFLVLQILLYTVLWQVILEPVSVGQEAISLQLAVWRSLTSSNKEVCSRTAL